MKRKISFGIAVLMILATCLFVSCNSEVSTAAQVNDGKLVYATFDKMSKAIRPSSSSMTISYELDNIDDLYWVYTATKTDGAGTTGQTAGERVPGNDEWKGLAGAIGPFSKGTWTFTVEGYKYIGTDSVTTNPTVAQLRDTGEGHQFNLIYVGTADGVVLNTTNTSTNPETINITVYLQTQGGTGTLKIAANSKFFWAATGEGGSALTDLKLKVYDGETLQDTIDLTGNASEGEGHAVYYSNANDTSINNLASGDHVFKVQIVRTVNNADQVFFEGTVNAKIYAGITTALDTQAIEGLFTYAQFNGTIDDSAVVVVATATETTTSAGSVSFETNYTPASGINPSTDKTTVSITGSDSIISAAKYNLGVETSNIIAAGAKFSVASDSTAVASVDLTLTKTEGETTTTIETFGDNGAATVTTYIAKNLTGVAFFYENTPFTKVETEGELGVDKFYYDGETGKLVFMTSHFSEFYVTSNDVAYNSNKGKAYQTLSGAISDYDADDTIHMLRDCTSMLGFVIENKNLFINTNNKTVTFDKNSTNLSDTGSRSFRVKSGELTVYGGGKLIAESNDTHNAGYYGVFRADNNGSLVLNDITLENSRSYGLNVKIIGGKADLNNVTINSTVGGGIEVTSVEISEDVYSTNPEDIGTATLKNCTFTQSEPDQANPWISTTLAVSGNAGLTVESGKYSSENGWSLYVYSSGGDITVKDGTYNGKITAVIDLNTYPGMTGSIKVQGGTFTSTSQEITFPASMSITGGTFNFNPSAYVAEGYEARQNLDGTWTVSVINTQEI